MNTLNEDFYLSGSLVDEDVRTTESKRFVHSSSPFLLPDQDTNMQKKTHLDKCHTQIKVKFKVCTLAWFDAISSLYFIILTHAG